MQDSRNQNATALLAVEYDVLTMLMTSQTWANVVTESAYCRTIRKDLTASLKLSEVPRGLVPAPLM
jgi:hypothetical protein